MGASQTRPEHNYDDLTDKSGFSQEQIKNLYQRFQQLSGNHEKISRDDLDRIPALNNNPIRKQIITAFFDKRNQHQNDVGSLDEIGFEQFLMVMSHFRPVNSTATEEEKVTVRKQKLRFLFNMHDTDNDGIITLDEYRTVVEELLSQSGAIETEVARSIADAAMLEVASTNVPHMAPDDFYEGITFEHFEQILKGIEMESRMSIRFLDMNTATMRCGKLSS
ncbi:tescalcin a isoform X1 [Haplochromis burtoni]|uniref:Calcineurin B homologous protein 3 n=1 Tax=Haplochromis burtoni TaxID=8153 RepID=A0A3Q2VEL6_HAPBU|nr:tescalcin a isoform X1 [Haplochromis burtoni]